VASDGALVAAPGSPFATGADYIYNLHADAAGKFVYTGDSNSEFLFAFAVNGKTAALTPLAGSPFAASLEPEHGTPVSKTLVVAQDADDDGLEDTQVFRRNKKTGGLTLLGGPQSSGFTGVQGGAIDSAGKLYAVAGTADAVRTFRLDKTTGILTAADTEAVDFNRVHQVLWIKR